MRILFINSVVDYGSTGKIVRDLATELESKGHEILITYGRNEAKVKESTFSISNRLEFVWHFVMTRIFGRHGLHSSLSTQKLINKIEEFKPDLIHLHNLHGYYLNVPKLLNYLKAKKEIQIVWTMHDLWAISGSSAHYSYAGCAEWNEGCIICRDPKEYPYSKIFDRQRKNFKWKKEVFSDFNNLKIVAVSDWLKEELEKSYIKQYDITRIYNGINYNDYVSSEQVKSIYDKGKINLLGVVSDWKPRKGSKDFIALSQKLSNDYKITVVGLSKEQLKTLPSTISGIEKTTNFSELVALYRDADLYLNLSAEETMGMTTVEALASGTPVVVYDQTAVPEIIDDSVGAISPINDIEKLKDTIMKTLDRKIPSDVCIDFARNHYSQDQMMKEYMNVYDLKKIGGNNEKT